MNDLLTCAQTALKVVIKEQQATLANLKWSLFS
jgi:hypothetical protein